MNYDREGLKTAGPSSRPSSRPNSKGDAPGTASDNNNTEKDVRVIARSNSTIEERPSSMATRSRQANFLSDRNTLTASPLHVPGKHQLGVLRGRKMHNRAHLLAATPDKESPSSSSKKQHSSSGSKSRSLRHLNGASKTNNPDASQALHYLTLSASAQSAATKIQRWMKRCCPNLSRHNRNNPNDSGRSLTTTPMGGRRPNMSRSRQRRPSLSSSGPQKVSQNLPSFMRLLDTQPTSPSSRSLTTDALNDHNNIDSATGEGGNDVDHNEDTQVRSRVLSGHTSTISDLCVLREGASSQKVAFSSASLDGTVRLWDPQTGESLCTLSHLQNGSSGSSGGSGGQPSGSASSQYSGSSTNSNSHKNNALNQEAPVSVLALDATQERSPILYSGTSDGSLWSWDVALGKLMKKVTQVHSGPITSLTVAAMETARVVTGSADNTVKVWDMRQKRPLVYTLRGHSAPITSLRVEPVWGRIFSGSRDQSLRVWDIRTGRQTHALQDHFGSVQCVVTSPYTLKGYVSGARDSSIKFWNMDGQCMKTIRAHKGVVYDMALQPLIDGVGGGHLMVGGHGDTMDNGTHDEMLLSSMNNLDETMMATSRGTGGVLGPLLASGGADGKVRLWDCTRKKCVSELDGHRGAVYACKWAGPDCVVSGSADSTVRAWDINSGQSLTLTGHTSAVTHVHCDKDCILSASKDTTLRLWSVGIAFGL